MNAKKRNDNLTLIIKHYLYSKLSLDTHLSKLNLIAN